MNPDSAPMGQPTPTPPQPNSPENDRQAAELARAKLSNIFGSTTPDPRPPLQNPSPPPPSSTEETISTPASTSFHNTTPAQPSAFESSQPQPTHSGTSPTESPQSTGEVPPVQLQNTIPSAGIQESIAPLSTPQPLAFTQQPAEPHPGSALHTAPAEGMSNPQPIIPPASSEPPVISEVATEVMSAQPNLVAPTPQPDSENRNTPDIQGPESKRENAPPSNLTERQATHGFVAPPNEPPIQVQPTDAGGFFQLPDSVGSAPHTANPQEPAYSPDEMIDIIMQEGHPKEGSVLTRMTLPPKLAEQRDKLVASSKKLRKSKQRTPTSSETKEPSRKGPLIKSIFAAAFIFVFVNSQVIFGQVRYYTSPGDEFVAPVIINTSDSGVVGAESRIIIPKINVDVPVVYDITTFDEREVQAGLKRGVVHYGNTALPGEKGNNVIVGHSSNNFWDSGKYKYAFVLLSKLEVGDTFSLHYNSTRYIYEVFDKRIVEPNDVSVLESTDESIVTLITCDPPGTSWNRLVVQAKQISPDPSKQQTASADISTLDESPLPGNTPSFIDTFRRWLGLD